MKTKDIKTFSKLDFVDEEGRHDIYNWSERRQLKYQGFRKSLHILQIYAFNTHLLRSFVENFNFMVILQMTLAAFITYLCQKFNISYDVHVSLFISPIVFPLAFSINTDFQRKEKVLEDLANFKSSAMMWFFCMRDWREACSMDLEYMKAVRNKIKGIVFHLREYLLTEKLDRRKFIVRVIYEDLSDANQLNEKVRCSSMSANSPLVARIIHFVNMMCLSFERLRVIREYRSPRSIRSFTKVLIFILPLLLSPYYVYLGTKHNKDNGETISSIWSPYYISIMVAFVFGALQGVQDKLDDPFDGMSEDDINLDTLDEWTLQSLEATCHRAYKIGRFQVVSSNMDSGKAPPPQPPSSMVDPLSSYDQMTKEDLSEDLEHGFLKYAGVLNNIQGNMTILRGGRVKKREKSFDDLGNLDRKSMLLSQALFSEQQNNLQSLFAEEPTFQEAINSTIPLPYTEEEPNTVRLIPSLNRLPSVDIIEADGTCAPTTVDDFVENDGAPTYGVASYLASVRRNNMSLRSQLDRQAGRNSSVSSNLSKRGSRSSIGSMSEITNDKPRTEFFIGDEAINKLSPIYQEVSSARFMSNGSSTSINPLLLNMHQNSDEDTDEGDEDNENVHMELTSLFENIQNRSSPLMENLPPRNSPLNDYISRHSPLSDNVSTNSRNNLNVRNFQRTPSPIFRNIKRCNSLSVNNLQNNMIDTMRRSSSGAWLAPNSNQNSSLLSPGSRANSTSPKLKSRFTVSKSSTSINIDDIKDDSTNETQLTNLESDMLFQIPRSSPSIDISVIHSHGSCASTNPSIYNMFENSVDGVDENAPIEQLEYTPLFIQSPTNSTENLKRLNEDIPKRTAPLPHNREIENIPLFDTLSPKSKQRFVINGAGKNNHPIFGNGQMIKDMKDDVFY